MNQKQVAEEKKSLQPGKFYSIKGKRLEWGQETKPVSISPAMYVRDERIRGSRWHVFASVENNGLLSRVKLAFDSISTHGLASTIIETDKPLDTKVVVLSKEERAKSVTAFIEEAYRLIRIASPNKRTLRDDAYRLAGVGGSPEPIARLRIIIDYHWHNDNRKEV